MGYITPADVGVSDNWQAHIDRGSKEPGTDYKTAFGTDLRMPGDGYISKVDNNPNGAEGRRLEMTMYNGQIIDFIHAYWIHGQVGQAITQGQTGIFMSGASGYGQEYYYGAHVHVTLRDNGSKPYSDTLNFEQYLEEEDDVDKQGVKDAMFEFYRDVKTFPPGEKDWPFFKQAVWNAPIQAQDENGNPLKDTNGNPILFDAGGFGASTNATVSSLKKTVDSYARTSTYLFGGVVILAIINLIVTVVT